jgi:metal-responsive CopG/Arc/MetJ family transcriptional regulator
MPEDMVVAIDAAILQEDSDRSKFVRNAVRDRVKRLGIKVPEAA